MNDDLEKPLDSDTSYHVHQACDGQSEHVEWIVRRFSPELLWKARQDLGPVLRRVYDAEDVVQNVWMAALEVLPKIPDRDGRFTPRLRQYMSKTLRNHVNKLLRDQVKKIHSAPEAPSDLDDPLDRLPAATANIVSKMVSRTVEEARRSAVYQALDSLDDIDRDILLLRSMDQLGNAEAASMLGINSKAAATRYHRAKKRLREQLRGTEAEDLFDE